MPWRHICSPTTPSTRNSDTIALRNEDRCALASILQPSSTRPSHLYDNLQRITRFKTKNCHETPGSYENYQSIEWPRKLFKLQKNDRKACLFTVMFDMVDFVNFRARRICVHCHEKSYNNKRPRWGLIDSYERETLLRMDDTFLAKENHRAVDEEHQQ